MKNKYSKMQPGGPAEFENIVYDFTFTFTASNGTTTNNLNIVSSSSQHGNLYQCKISDSNTTILSTIASLSVEEISGLSVQITPSTTEVCYTFAQSTLTVGKNRIGMTVESSICIPLTIPTLNYQNYEAEEITICSLRIFDLH